MSDLRNTRSELGENKNISACHSLLFQEPGNAEPVTLDLLSSGIEGKLQAVYPRAGEAGRRLRAPAMGGGRSGPENRRRRRGAETAVREGTLLDTPHPQTRPVNKTTFLRRAARCPSRPAGPGRSTQAPPPRPVHILPSRGSGGGRFQRQELPVQRGTRSSPPSRNQLSERRSSEEGTLPAPAPRHSLGKVTVKDFHRRRPRKPPGAVRVPSRGGGGPRPEAPGEGGGRRPRSGPRPPAAPSLGVRPRHVRAAAGRRAWPAGRDPDAARPAGSRRAPRACAARPGLAPDPEPPRRPLRHGSHAAAGRPAPEPRVPGGGTGGRWERRGRPGTRAGTALQPQAASLATRPAPQAGAAASAGLTSLGRLRCPGPGASVPTRPSCRLWARGRLARGPGWRAGRREV